LSWNGVRTLSGLNKVRTHSAIEEPWRILTMSRNVHTHLLKEHAADLSLAHVSRWNLVTLFIELRVGFRTEVQFLQIIVPTEKTFVARWTTCHLNLLNILILLQRLRNKNGTPAMESITGFRI